MPFREHSGFVVMICGDWAFTTDFDRPLPVDQVDSRIRDFVMFVKQHVANPRHIDPHVVRNEAPVEIIANPTKTGGVLVCNPVILGPKAWLIIADLHSDCAGWDGAHPGQEGDQRDPQVRRALRHGQRFIDSLAEHNGHPMRLILTWTRFGPGRSVLERAEIGSFVSRVEFDDDFWRDKVPSGLFMGQFQLAGAGVPTR